VGANNGQFQKQPKEGNTRIGQLHMGRCLYPEKNGSNMMVAHSTHVLESIAAAKEERHLVKDVYEPNLFVGNFRKNYKHFKKITKN
jgi:hypothetical protein